MEAFSLLKYWKTGGGGGGGPDPFFLSASRPAAPTVLTAISDEDNDDLFDLEFAAAQEDSDSDDDVAAAAAAEEDEEEEEEEAEELGFPLSSSSSSNDRTTVSPELNSGGPPPSSVLLPSLINKSATKFRVFLVGLKKPKPDAQRNEDDDVTKRGKLFAVRFKLEEAPFMSSLFKSQGQSQSQAKSKKGTEAEPVRFSKEGVQRYLKKVKPKLRSSGAGEGAAPATGRVVVERQVSLPLKVVYKHLGKSRSGSLSAVSSPAPEEDPVAGAFGVASKRRDDSLLQQQDGIQGAILHCKKSFNASRDSDASIDPASLEKLTELLSRKPSDSNGRGK